MLPPTLPSPSRGEGGGGGDVTLFIAFVLIVIESEYKNRQQDIFLFINSSLILNFLATDENAC
jgi:hypothetical protein